MKQRDTYVDVAKGICMLLIICIHTEVFGVIGMPLTFFAVPMFFFMSGFYDRSERPWAQWVKKSVMKLLLPAFIWVFVGTSYLSLLQLIKSGTIELKFNIFSLCTGNPPAWFLFSLFYVKILVGCLLRLCLPQYLNIALCFSIGYLGSEYQMPLNLDEALAAAPLYYCGKLLHPKMQEIINNKWIAFAGLTTLLAFVFTPTYYYNIGPSNPLFRPYYLLAIGGAFLVFAFILYISRILSNMKCLVAYGEKTLEVMLLHSLMCHTTAVCLNRVFEKGSTPWIISFLFAYVVIVVASYWFAILINMYCPILFGKRS